MFLDTSAIIEILLQDPKSHEMAERLQKSPGLRLTGPTVIYEATVVLAGKQNLSISEAERLVRALLQMFDVTVQPISDELASAALNAFARYGKGRHPAKLNFGDCFAYAGAKATGGELLYVGNDFPLTDLA